MRGLGHGRIAHRFIEMLSVTGDLRTSQELFRFKLPKTKRTFNLKPKIRVYIIYAYNFWRWEKVLHVFCVQALVADVEDQDKRLHKELREEVQVLHFNSLGSQSLEIAKAAVCHITKKIMIYR